LSRFTESTLGTFACARFAALFGRRLPEGNTLISCGNSAQVIEVDPPNKIAMGSEQHQRAADEQC